MLENAEPIQLGAPLTHFLRVVLEDGTGPYPLARTTGSQSSGILTSMPPADALLVVPESPLTVPAGTTLRAIPLDGDLFILLQGPPKQLHRPREHHAREQRQEEHVRQHDAHLRAFQQQHPKTVHRVLERVHVGDPPQPRGQ